MTIPLLLLTLHFVGDFALQSNWMATNKSTRWDALLLHCLVYSALFVPLYGTGFAAITFGLHFLTDAITSRVTSKLWFGEDLGEDPASGGRLIQWNLRKRHWFFVMIGFDQLIHFWCLAWTFSFLTF